MSETSPFRVFTNNISELPLWIKQVIYLEFKEELESSLTKSTIELINKENCFQLYVPKITFTGRKELETKLKNFSPDVYKFLEGAYQNNNIAEIAIENDWNLIETSSHFVETLNSELIMLPDSSLIEGTALYLSSHIRLGEYFVKLSKISIEQLDEALRIQKYLEEATDDKMGLGEVLVSFSFVTKADIDGIIKLKDEGKKRFLDKSSKLNETSSIN